MGGWKDGRAERRLSLSITKLSWTLHPDQALALTSVLGRTISMLLMRDSSLRLIA